MKDFTLFFAHLKKYCENQQKSIFINTIKASNKDSARLCFDVNCGKTTVSSIALTRAGNVAIITD